jgi:hypothetical protein
MVGWVFDGNTFVFVGDFNIMHPDVDTPQVDTVKTTLVSTPDDHVVYLSLIASIESQMEGRRVNQSDIMDGEICH